LETSAGILPGFGQDFSLVATFGQFAGKRKDQMSKRKKRRLHWDDSAEVIRTPAFPVPGFKLFDQLRSALSRNYGGRLLTLEDLAFMFRIPLSTAHDWFRTSPLAQVQALLCLLERLPAEEWQQMLRGYLRQYPTLEHPRLSDDPESVKGLENLLRQPTGLTVIQGGAQEDRSFLLTALGHAISRIDLLHRNAVGLDVHEPRTLVPITGVVYFRKSLNPARLRELLLQHWQEVEKSDSPMLLLNGVLSVVPELRSRILEAAAERHVIVAEEPLSSPGLSSARASSPIHVILLSKPASNPSKLRATIKAIAERKPLLKSR
jgi:hypothetical protein